VAKDYCKANQKNSNDRKPKKIMEKNVAIDFGHKGTMLGLVAGTYPSVLKSLGEYVQNALDVDATVVRISVNLKTRNISIRDNGCGINEEEFRNALLNVCVTQKKFGKLGRYGLGLVSALGKCRDFIFVSHRAGDKRAGFLEWQFDSRYILGQKDISIPLRSRPDLTDEKSKEGKGITFVEWRTEVSIHGITDNALINRLTLDMLTEHLIGQYNKALQKTGARIFIRFTNESGHEEEEREVSYRSCTGAPIPEYRHKNTKGDGQTVFQLFLAKSFGGKRNGKVQVGETNNPFRFSWNDFATSAVDWLDDDAVSLLKSAIFEGEITDNKVKLHARRDQFVQNPDMVNFCNAVNHWTKEIGLKLQQEVEEDRTDDRFQRIALESLSRIEALIKGTNDVDLCRVLESFKRGSIGRGHLLNPNDVLGTQEERSLSVDGGVEGERDSSRGGNGDGREDTTKTLPSHTPYTASGPRGTRRKIVRHDSLGIHLEHSNMPGSSELWVFDGKTGIVQINKRHPHFVACLGDDKWLKRLEEHILISALRVQATPEDWRDFAKMFIENMTGDVVFLLTNTSIPKLPSKAVKEKRK